MCDMSDDVNCVLCGDGGGGNCATCGRRVVMIPMASFDERQDVIDYVTTNISKCVCVYERERERERETVLEQAMC